MRSRQARSRPSQRLASADSGRCSRTSPRLPRCDETSRSKTSATPPHSCAPTWPPASRARSSTWMLATARLGWLSATPNRRRRGAASEWRTADGEKSHFTALLSSHLMRQLPLPDFFHCPLSAVRYLLTAVIHSVKHTFVLHDLRVAYGFLEV